jgi:hypothetical protein
MANATLMPGVHLEIREGQHRSVGGCIGNSKGAVV